MGEDSVKKLSNLLDIMVCPQCDCDLLEFNTADYTSERYPEKTYTTMLYCSDCLGVFDHTLIRIDLNLDWKHLRIISKARPF